MTRTITLGTSDSQVDNDEAAANTIGPVEPSIVRPLSGLRAVDLWILGALFLWPCAFLPMFANQSWTPRVMALLVALPTGALAIGSLLRRRDRAAMFAAAALCWALVGAAFSGNAILSLKGVVAMNSSVLIYGGSIGLWATARFMSVRGKALVAPVFVGAGLVNVLVGIVQVVFRIDSSAVSLQGDRAVGLIGNSVWFGAVVAAGGAMSMHLGASRAHRVAARLWLAAAFALSLGVAISGSRAAMVALLVAGLAGVITAPRARAAMSMGVSLAGVLVGSMLGIRDSVSRLSESRSGGRTTLWRTSLDAILERPITGWGLGRFRYALQGRYSIDELVVAPGLRNFWDAHNVVIELAVVVGIPGLILFGGFAWCAGRRCVPAMGVAAGAIVLTWMLQPISHQTLPIAMMLLGAGGLSASGTDAEQMLGGHRRSVVGAAIVLGVAPALVLGVADMRLKQAVDAWDARGAGSAAAIFFHDPNAANTAATVAWSKAAVDPESQRIMVNAFSRSVEIEPENPYWWNELAMAQGAILRDPDAARRSADRALDLSSFDERAWNTVWVASTELGDLERRLEAAEILCRFEVERACDDLEAERS